MIVRWSHNRFEIRSRSYFVRWGRLGIPAPRWARRALARLRSPVVFVCPVPCPELILAFVLGASAWLAGGAP